VATYHGQELAEDIKQSGIDLGHLTEIVMASIIREFTINATPEEVWSVIGDFANGPMKVAAGALVDCRLETPDLRTLVFADGTEAQERLIGRDETARRIVWAWVDKEVMHDNGSMQVFDQGEKQSRVVWVHDTLPEKAAEFVAQAMDQQVPLMKKALGSEG
jgi:Polyketide cyclase / dehydrase and lipid transport